METVEDSLCHRQSTGSYDQKCKIFESALRKIDLEDFIIHDRVDEFLKEKRMKENLKHQIPNFAEIIAQQGDSHDEVKEKKVIEDYSNQNFRKSISQDLRV